jgi:hypothetical protein
MTRCGRSCQRVVTEAALPLVECRVCLRVAGVEVPRG